jgi:hypothetical protein
MASRSVSKIDATCWSYFTVLRERIPLFGTCGLASQIGSIEYARPRRFREKLDGWLEAIRLLWPDCPAKISSDGTSLEINRAIAVLVEQKACRVNGGLASDANG